MAIYSGYGCKPRLEYFTASCPSGGNQTFYIDTYNGGSADVFQYRLLNMNNNPVSEWDYCNSNTSFNCDLYKIQLKCNETNPNYNPDDADNHEYGLQFAIEAQGEKVVLEGNIESLHVFSSSPWEGATYKMFANFTNKPIDVSNLIMPMPPSIEGHLYGIFAYSNIYNIPSFKHFDVIAYGYSYMTTRLFEGCNYLKDVVFDIKSLDMKTCFYKMFDSCSNIEKIYLPNWNGLSNQSAGIDGWLDNAKTGGTIYVKRTVTQEQGNYLLHDVDETKYEWTVSYTL